MKMRKLVALALAAVMLLSMMPASLAISPDHTHHWKLYQTVTNATCTSTGLAIYWCEGCASTERRVIPKSSHRWSDWTVTREPTDTLFGLESRTCSRCGSQQNRFIYTENTVARNSKDEEKIRVIQEQLWDLGLIWHKPSGVYDEETENGVKRHQAEAGIDATGIAYPETQESLNIRWQEKEDVDPEQEEVIRGSVRIPIYSRYTPWESNGDGTHSRLRLDWRKGREPEKETENCVFPEHAQGEAAACEKCGYAEQAGLNVKSAVLTNVPEGVFNLFEKRIGGGTVAVDYVYNGVESGYNSYNESLTVTMTLYRDGEAAGDFASPYEGFLFRDGIEFPTPGEYWAVVTVTDGRETQSVESNHIVVSGLELRGATLYYQPYGVLDNWGEWLGNATVEMDYALNGREAFEAGYDFQGLEFAMTLYRDGVAVADYDSATEGYLFNEGIELEAPGVYYAVVSVKYEGNTQQVQTNSVRLLGDGALQAALDYEKRGSYAPGDALTFTWTVTNLSDVTLSYLWQSAWGDPVCPETLAPGQAFSWDYAYTLSEADGVDYSAEERAALGLPEDGLRYFGLGSEVGYINPETDEIISVGASAFLPMRGSFLPYAQKSPSDDAAAPDAAVSMAIREEDMQLTNVHAGDWVPLCVTVKNEGSVPLAFVEFSGIDTVEEMSFPQALDVGESQTVWGWYQVTAEDVAFGHYIDPETGELSEEYLQESTLWLNGSVAYVYFGLDSQSEPAAWFAADSASLRAALTDARSMLGDIALSCQYENRAYMVGEEITLNWAVANVGPEMLLKRPNDPNNEAVPSLPDALGPGESYAWTETVTVTQELYDEGLGNDPDGNWLEGGNPEGRSFNVVDGNILTYYDPSRPEGDNEAADDLFVVVELLGQAGGFGGGETLMTISAAYTEPDALVAGETLPIAITIKNAGSNDAHASNYNVTPFDNGDSQGGFNDCRGVLAPGQETAFTYNAIVLPLEEASHHFRRRFTVYYYEGGSKDGPMLATESVEVDFVVGELVILPSDTIMPPDDLPVAVADPVNIGIDPENFYDPGGKETDARVAVFGDVAEGWKKETYQDGENTSLSLSALNCGEETFDRVLLYLNGALCSADGPVEKDHRCGGGMDQAGSFGYQIHDSGDGYDYVVISAVGEYIGKDGQKATVSDEMTLVLPVAASPAAPKEGGKARLFLVASKMTQEPLHFDGMGNTSKVEYMLTVSNPGEAPCVLSHIRVFAPEGYEQIDLGGQALAPGNAVNVPAGHIFNETQLDPLDGLLHISFVAVADVDTDVLESNEAALAHEASKETVNWAVPDETSLTLKKEAISAPALPGGYQLGEKIAYRLTVTNTGAVAIPSVAIRDDLIGSGDLDEIKDLQPNESRTAESGYYYIVQQSDVDAGQVYNIASAVWADTASGKQRTQKSNPVTVFTLKETPGESKEGESGAMLFSIPGLTVVKEETSVCPNGQYYQENDVIQYRITYKNTGDVPLKNVKLFDCLKDSVTFSGFSAVATLNPGEERVYNFSYTVTGQDVLAGQVKNYALVLFSTDTLTDCPVASAPVISLTGGGTGYTPVESQGKEDSCVLRLVSLDKGMDAHLLSFCEEHAKVAAQVEGNSFKNSSDPRTAANGWSQAKRLWQAETDKLYQRLLDKAVGGDARLAVMQERAAFYAYVNAAEAMLAAHRPDLAAKAAAEMLQRQAAALCYLLHHAPETPRPDSRVGSAYGKFFLQENSMGDEPIVVCSRHEEYTDGAAMILDALCEDHREIAALTDDALAAAATPEEITLAFRRAQRLYRDALDAQATESYKAADPAQRPQIAAARMAFDILIEARQALLESCYPNDAKTVAEELARAWRDALIDRCMLDPAEPAEAVEPAAEPTAEQALAAIAAQAAVPEKTGAVDSEALPGE